MYHSFLFIPLTRPYEPFKDEPRKRKSLRIKYGGRGIVQ
jgi:hypothetical protein